MHFKYHSEVILNGISIYSRQKSGKQFIAKHVVNNSEELSEQHHNNKFRNKTAPSEYNMMEHDKSHQKDIIKMKTLWRE